jgi:hypothetical protein
MNALVCATRDAAIMQSQAWIDAEGLGDVAKAKHFVQKIPLNKVYDMAAGEANENYLFYPPHITITEGLRQEAAEINTLKMVKINNLEDQIKAIRENMPPMPRLTPLPEE